MAPHPGWAPSSLSQPVGVPMVLRAAAAHGAGAALPGSAQTCCTPPAPQHAWCRTRSSLHSPARDVVLCPTLLKLRHPQPGLPWQAQRVPRVWCCSGGALSTGTGQARGAWWAWGDSGSGMSPCCTAPNVPLALQPLPTEQRCQVPRQGPCSPAPTLTRVGWGLTLFWGFVRASLVLVTGWEFYP